MIWFLWAQFVFAVRGKFEGHVSKDGFFRRMRTLAKIVLTSSGGNAFIASLVQQAHAQKTQEAELQLAASNRATRRANSARHKKASKR